MTGPAHRAAAAAAVAVELGQRRYEVLIGPGLMAASGALIAERFPGARAAIVTDRNVAGHYDRVVAESLGWQPLFRDRTAVLLIRKDRLPPASTLRKTTPVVPKSQF